MTVNRRVSDGQIGALRPDVSDIQQKLSEFLLNVRAPFVNRRRALLRIERDQRACGLIENRRVFGRGGKSRGESEGRLNAVSGWRIVGRFEGRI